MGWKKGPLNFKPGSSDWRMLLQEFMCVFVCFQFKNFITVFCIAHIFIENFLLKALLRMNVNLYMIFILLSGSSLWCLKRCNILKVYIDQTFIAPWDALVSKDISGRYDLCTSFYFSFPRVLSSCLCNFCLSPLLWLPMDLEVLWTFPGTGVSVLLTLPCISLMTLAFGAV